MSRAPANTASTASASTSGNRRRAPSTKKIITAPSDPLPSSKTDDESPPPGPAIKTVRERPAKPSRTLGKIARSLQLLAGVMVVLAASVAVAWGARRYIMSSPRFAIRTVLVDGIRRRSADQVASTGGVAVGGNIFALDPEAAGAAIATDPWIERATVTRRLPSTIQIDVIEREARAAAAIGGELYLATREGDLFKRVDQNDPDDLPLVTGISPERVASDRPGVVLSIKRVLDVMDDLDRSGISRRYPVQELHLERDEALVVTIGREAIALHLGHPPFRAKIEQGARVLTEIARRKADASVIFLDNDANPERVVVRMR